MARSTLYRALLRAYPRDFRAEYGDEMAAAFDECAERERGRRGMFAAPRIALRAAIDTVHHASQVRLELRRARRRRERSFDLALNGAGSSPSRKGIRMPQLLQDIRIALRVLAKDRSFTATVLLTLAICIGANAAIFAIVQSVLLRPLPVPDAEQLVYINNSYPNAGAARASNGVPDYFDRLAGMPSMQELAVYRRTGAILGSDTGAERVIGVQASPSLLRMLKVQPIAGTIFQESDSEPGKDTKVLLSEGLWRTRFASRPDIVGQQMRINGVQRTIVGVLPGDFRFLWSDVTLWIPTAFTPEDKADDRRHSNSWQMVGRLKPGASVQQAQDQLDAINRLNDERFPHFRQPLKDAGFHTEASLLQDDLVREVRPVLYLLWGGVLFVLLIGAVNITNLVIVRSSARQRELATRHAIGAGIGRLARQLVTETMVLAIAGGLLGLALGRFMLTLLPSLGLDEMPRAHEITMDPASMAVVMVGSLVVGLLVSLVPVARVWRLNLNQALREDGRGGTASRRSMYVRRALATAQIGLAFLLLVGAGLLFASFRHVLSISPGINPDGVVTGVVGLTRAKYGTDDAIRGVADRTLERLRAVPGVQSVALTDTLPFGKDFSDSVILAEGYAMRPGESVISPTTNVVTAGYFETMGIGLVEGRYFDTRDTPASANVIIIDQKLAKKFWPGQSPLGRRMIRPGSPEEVLKPGPNSVYYNVIGVVEDVPLYGLAEESRRVGAYYFPMAQSPSSFSVVARTSLDPESLAGAIRREVAAIDPEVPFYNVTTMRDVLDESLVNRRLPMQLAIAFGIVALFLSAIGIYGVLAYQVAQRRREIGIRMALGSSVRGVFGLVVADGARIVVIGLALGLGGAYLLGAYIEAQLFGVRALDPGVIATVAALLAAVSFAAVAIPARRAARVSPVVALAGQ